MYLVSGRLRNGLPILCHRAGRADRNLSVGEMVEQVRNAALAMSEGEVGGSEGRLSNIVFMGMGEPLANYKRVVEVIG